MALIETSTGGSSGGGGSVAVTSVIPGTGATNLGKAEDAVHASGDVGVMSLAVRNDAGTALSADGDYSVLQTDSIGRLRVTGGGTSNVDDSAFGIGVDSVVPTGLLADETATDSVNEGDVGIPRMTLNRKAIHASEFLEDSPHVSGDYGTQVLSVRTDATTTLGADGDYVPFQTDSNGRLKVNASVVSATDGAAFAAGVDSLVPSGFYVSDTTLALVDEGDVALPRITTNRRVVTSSETQDDAVPETGSKVGLMGAVFDNTGTDSVDENDAGYVRMSANRNQYMQIRDSAGNERGVNVTAASELNVIATAQPGVDIGDVTINNAAGAAAVNIQDGGNSITVDGTVAATQSGTWNIATVTTVTGATISNGAGASAVNIQDGGNSITVDGTVAVSGTVTTSDTATQVDDAAFTPASSRIMMIGAQADETATDSVNEGDGGALRMTLDRRLIDAGQYVDDTAFGVATGYVNATAYLADETATDSLDEGDIGIARMTLDRRQIDAAQVLDDAAFGIGTGYVSVVGYLADETATDSVNEGDVGAARMTLDRKTISASQFIDDTAWTVATNYVTIVGALADMTSPDAVDEGDIGALRMDLSRNLQVSMATQLDDTNDAVNAVPKMKATGTGMTFLAATITTMTNTEIAVKTSGGQLGGWSFVNRDDDDIYVQTFNDTTTTVVPGTTVPQIAIMVPKNGSINQEFFGSMPISFPTAITMFASKSRTASTAPDVALEVNGIFGI